MELGIILQIDMRKAGLTAYGSRNDPSTHGCSPPEAEGLGIWSDVPRLELVIGAGTTSSQSLVRLGACETVGRGAVRSFPVQVACIAV